MNPAPNGASSSSPAGKLTPSAYRNMARLIQTYPWKTTFVPTQDDLTQGWEHNGNNEAGWITYQDIERIAGKISAFEYGLFQGAHNLNNMATRGFLEFKLYESSTSIPALRHLAAEATRTLTSIPHGWAQAHGCSLITSYRLLDILSFQYNLDKAVTHHLSERPLDLASSTRFIDNYGQRLSDVKKLLFDFKTAWEASRKKRDSSGKSSGEDLLLVHIKQALSLGQISHAQKVEQNVLAAALPITIMTMNESLSENPPELLEGLDSLVEKKVFAFFSQNDKEKIVKLFNKQNIRDMRKPHAMSVHVTPLVSLFNANLQKSVVSEDDMIQTSRIIGTHNIPLLNAIERCIWRAIFQIANGTNPLDAIDCVVQRLPWNDIGAIKSDDEINKRFKPNYAPAKMPQRSPSRQTQQTQVFDQGQYSTTATLQNDENSSSSVGQRQESTGNTTNMVHKRRKQRSEAEEVYQIRAEPTVPLLLSADAKAQEGIAALSTTKPFALCYTDNDWSFYDPLGNSWTVPPMFHTVSDNLGEIPFFENVIESTYKNDRPRHISAREESVLEVITQVQRQSMTSREAQRLLRTRHVIQVAMEQTVQPFDLKTLSLLGALDRSILVEDESIPNGDIGRVFSLSGLYNMRDSGRAISTQEMPAKSFIDVDAFSTGRRAYEYRKYCPEKDHTDSADRPYPTQWSLAALTGTARGMQISPDGAGTFAQCLSGKILYILLRPKGSLDQSQFSRDHLFKRGVNLDDLVPKSFDVEGVLLLPGMAIFIRPCTPYCVLSLENAITHGEYFYSLSTMRESFLGLAHNLANGSWIRPSRGQALRHTLRLIVQYVRNALIDRIDMDVTFLRHAMNPDSLTIDDVEDLLSVISIGILSNALDVDTYKLHPQAADQELSEHLAQARWEAYDYNALPYDDRIGCTLGRGFAYELRDWLCHFYDIRGHTGTTAKLIQKVIAHQASVLLKVTQASNGDEKFLCAVKRQIKHIFRPDTPESTFLFDNIARIEQGTASSSMFVSFEGCIVTKIDNPGQFQPRSIQEIYAHGISALDDKYEKGRECAFEVCVEEAKKRRRTGDE